MYSVEYSRKAHSAEVRMKNDPNANNASEFRAKLLE